MLVEIYPSSRQGKKWLAYFPELHKSVHFGAAHYEDYTTHKDPARKARYITRHERREAWDNPLTAGFWSRWLLWNKPTLRGSARDIERRFGLRIRLN